MPNPRRLSFLILAVLLIAGGATTGCSTPTAGGTEHTHTMAPLEQMPAEVRDAPTLVQAAYQFAVGNPDVLKNIPCYCGCGGIGHTSNYSCYVAGANADGSTKFDTHALGCSICVDITQDVMRLFREGSSTQDIRGYVDQMYSRYGPSNIAE